MNNLNIITTVQIHDTETQSQTRGDDDFDQYNFFVHNHAPPASERIPPTNVMIIFAFNSVMSSGSKKMVAPSFLATLMAYLEFKMQSSMLSPRVTRSQFTT
mmetsp:Transcript_14864/g.36346  ORF Transcript_14864/g.36346 Transcript_14864/m.36346 type:complete len:101 (+) Transcript_14864:133-435(+)